MRRPRRRSTESTRVAAILASLVGVAALAATLLGGEVAWFAGAVASVAAAAVASAILVESTRPTPRDVLAGSGTSDDPLRLEPPRASPRSDVVLIVALACGISFAAGCAAVQFAVLAARRIGSGSGDAERAAAVIAVLLVIAVAAFLIAWGRRRDHAEATLVAAQLALHVPGVDAVRLADDVHDERWVRVGAAIVAAGRRDRDLDPVEVEVEVEIEIDPGN